MKPRLTLLYRFEVWHALYFKKKQYISPPSSAIHAQNLLFVGDNGGNEGNLKRAKLYFHSENRISKRKVSRMGTTKKVL